MKWKIPAKTFLLGEYAALTGSSAIVLTTKPYFEVALTYDSCLQGIHPNSPAGIWWRRNAGPNRGLSWYDPYNGLGGLGASSAQFLASYLASCTLQRVQPCLKNILDAYYQSSWTGVGLRPSGYDLIAQSQGLGCVYINADNQSVQSYKWPFRELSFLLVHTGVKLATHHHLQEASLPANISELSTIVDQGKCALEQVNSEQLIKAVNNYHAKLSQLNLVAQHSLNLIEELKAYRDILAIKGCGALGSDVILVLTTTKNSLPLKNKLILANRFVVATEKNSTSFKNPSLLALT